MDDRAHDFLRQAALPNVSLLKASEIETPELKAVKPGRSIGEYCWTMTPFAPRFVFETDPSIDRVTYLDADMWFRKKPDPIFAELNKSGKHVLITDHSYAPEFDQSATSGQFCVQFMTFSRKGGEEVRKWWEERCIEWCFARFEESKFGDQKYLDDWPNRFDGAVHVLQHIEWMLGPWNSTRFPYNSAIVHHFHGLRMINSEECLLSGYPIPKPTLDYIYRPYLSDLKAATNKMIAHNFTPQPQSQKISTSKYQNIKELLKGIYFMKWYYQPYRVIKY